MYTVPLDAQVVGARLGRDIVDPRGRVLLAAGTLLTPRHIEQLRLRGWRSVPVHDDLAPEAVPVEVIHEETRTLAMAAVDRAFERIAAQERIHLEAVWSVVDQILADIDNHRALAWNLSSLRNLAEGTLTHSVNVCVYSVILGEALGFHPEDNRKLGVGALLHDVGKVYHMDLVRKEGPLDADEWVAMQRHAADGFELLRTQEGVDLVSAHIAFQHHERMDGSGYPRGLTGDRIHLWAQITAIADVYDTITGDRPYGPALAPHAAMGELQALARKGKLQARLVRYLCDRLAAYPEGTVVILASGEVGVVVGHEAKPEPTPVVRVVTDARLVLTEANVRIIDGAARGTRIRSALSRYPQRVQQQLAGGGSSRRVASSLRSAADASRRRRQPHASLQRGTRAGPAARPGGKLAAGAEAAGVGGVPMPGERPHILLVVCHDLGRHLGCCGVAGLATPHLDGLAADGVLFERYFATAPLCSPSRGSILTGRYPHSNGLMGLVNRGWDMPDGTPTLPQVLAEAGYDTHLFGFHHEKRDPRRMGYAHVAHVDGPHHAAFLLPRVAEFLRGAAAATRPFLAVVGLSEVHRPFKGPRYQPDDPRGVEVPGYLPDDPAVREDLADLHGLVRAVDREMAGVLRALEEADLARRTLVLFTTDHGIAFPRAKSTLYDAGLGTALIARWPGVLPAGARSPDLLSNVDLMPTLLEAAGVPSPAGVQGLSFWRAALAAGAQQAPRSLGAGPRQAVFAEKTYHDAYDPVRAVRTDRWKYIRSFEAVAELLLPMDIAASPSARAPAIAEATGRPRAPEELYDLAADPHERRNLADDPGAAPDLAAMRERLAAWMRETDDPLLRGPVPGMGADA